MTVNSPRPVPALSAERIEAVLTMRAARLARPLTSDSSLMAGRRALVIHLGNEEYAIEVRHLAAVIGHAQCARVPGSMPEIAGLVAFRGRVAPIVDLALLLGTPADSAALSRPVLMLRGTPRPVGLAVSVLGEILLLPHKAVDSMDAGKKGIARFVSKPHDGFPWIIQVETLMSHYVMKGLLHTQP